MDLQQCQKQKKKTKKEAVQTALFRFWYHVAEEINF